MEIMIQDKEVFSLIVKFLNSKGLFWTSINLQMETGADSNMMQNDLFLPEPFAILHECCLEGRWQDVSTILKPFAENFKEELDWKNVICLLYRQRFCELCFDGHLEDAQFQLKDIIEEVTVHYNNDEHDQIVKDVCNYYNRIVSKQSNSFAMKQITRAETFRELLALIKPILESNGVEVMQNDNRLVNLLAKGLLFDQCEKYCYERATGKPLQSGVKATLDDSLNQTADQVAGSLFNWIRSLKDDALFQHKFVDEELKIVQKQLSDQDDATSRTPTTECARERLDSTYVSSTAQAKSEGKPDSDLTYTTEPNVSSVSVAPSSFPTTTNQTAAPASEPIVMTKDTRVADSVSVRAAWGKAFIPDVTNVPDHLTDVSTEIMPPVMSQPPATVAPTFTPQVTIETPVKEPKSPVSTNPTVSKDTLASHPLSPHPSGNPALWAQPSSSVSPNVNSSIRDSYADFINEQSIARRDYKHLMEQLQEKQNEAQNLRNFLQGGTTVTGALPQAMGQDNGGFAMSKSVDHTCRPNQAQQQQGPEKLPHTDRVVAAAPAFHPSPPQRANEDRRNKPPSPMLAGGDNPLTAPALEKPEKTLSKSNAKPRDVRPPRPKSYHGEGPGNLSVTASLKEIRFEPLPRGFHPYSRTDDPGVIRSVAFHPNGHVMAIGSNSRVLKLCAVPEQALLPISSNALADPSTPERLQVIVKKSQIHRGSIYALAWNDSGTILTTCSNDKLIKIFNYNEDSHSLLGPQYELTHHDGMVRDITFLKGYGSGSVLASGGSTDFVVYTYACEVDTVVHQLTGHSDQILSLYSWNGGMLASASQDRSVRVWDLRSSRCVSVLGFGKSTEEQSIPLSVCVDGQGNYLGVGRDDALVSVYDLRAARLLGDCAGHSGEVRSVRFNPVKSHFLMSSSYDSTALITDISSLCSENVGIPTCLRSCNFHTDKIIQCRWHQEGLSFATTSADQSCVLWRTIEA